MTKPFLEDVTLKLIYNQLPLTKKQKSKIIELELQEEYKNLYINAQVENWIRKCIKAERKVIFTSDMYLTTKQLKLLILSKLKDKKLISKVYVSNKYNATKATGKLFDIVLKDLNIKPWELLHIGDSYYADIEIAKAKDINTLYYNCDESLKDTFKLESNYIKEFNKNNNYRIQASLLNPYSKEDNKFFFNLGATVFGAVMWEFSHWINNLTKINNISQVNCVMREGRIFKKYISKVNPKLDTNLIYASRKSTYLPSINIEDIKEKGFEFYNYRKFSVQNFYHLFKLTIDNKNIKEHEEVLLRNANMIIIDSKISLLELIANDIKNKLDTIETNINYEKNLFKKYLKQFDYKKDSLLIDFGGTGTILKNINNALKDNKKQKLNILFYMHESGFNKMLGDNILTFLPYSQKTAKHIELIRRSPEFIEILFNGVNQTTLHYKKRKNKVIAVTDFPYVNQKLIAKYIKAFDKGIDSFFKIAKQYNLKQNLYSKDTLTFMLSRLIDVPTIQEAANLGNLYHDEGYGNLSVEKLISDEHVNTIDEFGMQKAYFHNTNNPTFQIGKIPWVQGVITRLEPQLIKKAKALENKGINSTAIDKIIEELSQNKNIKNVYIFGVGQFFNELYPSLLKMDITIKGLIDSRAYFSSLTSCGFNVKPLKEVDLEKGDTIIISSSVFAIEITDSIINYCKEKKYTNISILNHYNNLITI